MVGLLVPLCAETTVVFNFQTNHIFCGTEADPVMSPNFPCVPKEFYLAGVVATARTDESGIVAYRFTITYDLTATGKPGPTKIQIVEARDGRAGVLEWIGKDLTDFSNVKVSAEPLRSGVKATAQDPGKQVSEFAYYAPFEPTQDTSASIWMRTGKAFNVRLAMSEETGATGVIRGSTGPIRIDHIGNACISDYGAFVPCPGHGMNSMSLSPASPCWVIDVEHQLRYVSCDSMIRDGRSGSMTTWISTVRENVEYRTPVAHLPRLEIRPDSNGKASASITCE